MAFVTLEDVLESVEILVFPETYANCYKLLDSTEPVVVRGTVQKGDQGIKIVAEEIDPCPMPGRNTPRRCMPGWKPIRSAGSDSKNSKSCSLITTAHVHFPDPALCR